jgi:large subunit ribosomal protein L20
LPRAKGGVVTRHRHNRVLKLTRGHRGKRRNIFKRAHESMIHALNYSYFHRKERAGDMRRLWIVRINAASRANGLSYNQLIKGLKEANIDINRKMLAEMAVSDPNGFSRIVSLITGKSDN